MTPLEQQITELWGHITAATYRFLELIGELDEAGCYGVGIASSAHWLNLYCGIGIVAAREKVRVARAIRQLPKISAAFRDGRVSYSKVRAMTRVATPENEDILLDIALYGTASHVERTARYFRRVESAEAAQYAAAAQQERFLQIVPQDDGQVLIHGRVPAEVGELFRCAVERAIELGNLGAEMDGRIERETGRHPCRVSDIAVAGAGSSSSSIADTDADADANTITDAGPDFSTADDSAESRRRAGDVETAVPENAYPIGARRADALRVIAQQFLAAEAEASGAAASARFQVVVHIDQAVLSHRPCADDSLSHRRPMLAEFEDGPTLAAETARRLACDGALIGIVDGDKGEPLNVGRKTRAISPALRRALKARDGGCRFPGCTHTRYTEAHHVEHWAQGGETKLANLITLCHFHHHLLHEGGFGLKCTDDGLFVFTAPGGERLPEYIEVERRFRGSALAAINRRRGIDIEPGTIVTRWQGERMDYSMAVEGLLAARLQ